MCFDNHYGSARIRITISRPRIIIPVELSIGLTPIRWKSSRFGSRYERGAEFFSPHICNVKYYNEGHYLVHSGGVAYDSEGNPSRN